NHGGGGDSESRDRASLNLDEEQVKKIKQIASYHPKTVVCLIAGSPIAMNEWIGEVEAVMMCWYGGMEAGHAIANVLFGDVSPSGKLPLTFPKRLEDSPAHSTGNPRNYPGDEDKRIYYDEGIYVGYRWFDKKKIEPLFPFGFGLSYTKFEYGDVSLNRQSMSKPDAIIAVNVDITNTGQRAGSEVIQVYSNDVDSSIDRPPQELIGFEKVRLNPGESISAAIKIRAEDLAFYDAARHGWRIEPGEFKLLVGKSSRNIFEDTEISYG
ncbi:MAG: glycoside hydrolase family 3 C-terminal domain-containing protein, partial [Promethearchaeota archaeon]